MSDPVISAAVRADGTAVLSVDGTDHDVAAETPEEARRRIIALVAARAAEFGSALPVAATDPDGRGWRVLIHPDGAVAPAPELAESGRIAGEPESPGSQSEEVPGPAAQAPEAGGVPVPSPAVPDADDDRMPAPAPVVPEHEEALEPSPPGLAEPAPEHSRTAEPVPGEPAEAGAASAGEHLSRAPGHSGGARQHSEQPQSTALPAPAAAGEAGSAPAPVEPEAPAAPSPPPSASPYPGGSRLRQEPAPAAPAAPTAAPAAPAAPEPPAAYAPDRALPSPARPAAMPPIVHETGPGPARQPTPPYAPAEGASPRAAGTPGDGAGGVCRTAVIGIGRQAGATTTAIGIGAALAPGYSEGVVLLDTHHHAPLAGRLLSQVPHTMIDLAESSGRVDSVARLRAYLASTPGGLYALSGRGSGVADYEAASRVVERFTRATVVDCRPDLADPMAQATLSRSTRCVLVMEPSGEALAAGQAVWRWIASSYPGLARAGTVALNRRTPKAAVPPGTEEAFAAYGLAVVTVPFDRRLQRGGVVDATRLRQATRTAYGRLAGLVAQR